VEEKGEEPQPNQEEKQLEESQRKGSEKSEVNHAIEEQHSLSQSVVDEDVERAKVNREEEQEEKLEVEEKHEEKKAEVAKDVEPE